MKVPLNNNGHFYDRHTVEFYQNRWLWSQLGSVHTLAIFTQRDIFIWRFLVKLHHFDKNIATTKVSIQYLNRKMKKNWANFKLSFSNGPTQASFLFIFSRFQFKIYRDNCRRLQDSNSDCQSRKRARWPHCPLKNISLWINCVVLTGLCSSCTCSINLLLLRDALV